MIKRNFMEILGEKIYYKFQDNKSKYTVLFVHGFLSSTDFMAPIWQSKSQYNVMSLDLPSNGQSSSNKKPSIELYQNVVNEFINRMPQKKFIVLGHSLGGASAAYAAINNKKVIKLILLSVVNPFMIKNEITRRLLLKLIEPSTQEEAQHSVKSLMENNPLQQSQKNINALAQSLLNMINASKTKFHWMIENQILSREYLANDLRNLYSEITVPTLIIHGDKDHYVSIRSAKELAKFLNLTPLIITNCGHAPIYEKPNVIPEIINAFVMNRDLTKFIKKHDSNSALRTATINAFRQVKKIKAKTKATTKSIVEQTKRKIGKKAPKK